MTTKNFFKKTVAASVFALLCVATSFAQSTNIEINATNFPDANFREALGLMTIGKDGVLTPGEIKGTYTLNVSNKNIDDLQGIEFFTALTTLRCDNNRLSFLDLSKLTKLEEIFCNNNLLYSLNVSGLINVKYMYCNNNRLSSLDVSSMTSVMGLNCSSNNLSVLDVSKLRSLKSLECRYNQLSSLDVSLLTHLELLICSDNKLTSLDMLGATKLADLDCSFNKLPSLDISDLIGLRTLKCGNNQIASLDFSSSPLITQLFCENNQLSSLNVSALTDLAIFECNPQRPVLTLTGKDKNYSLEIPLNNPTKLQRGISYNGSKLISTSKEIKTSLFEVNVIGNAVKMGGSFTLQYEEATGISEIKAENRKITGYYNIAGAQLPQEPQSGLFIILYDDGTAEKVMKKQ